jgi:hypothetical protein
MSRAEQLGAQQRRSLEHRRLPVVPSLLDETAIARIASRLAELVRQIVAAWDADPGPDLLIEAPNERLVRLGVHWPILLRRCSFARTLTRQASGRLVAEPPARRRLVETLLTDWWMRPPVGEVVAASACDLREAASISVRCGDAFVTGSGALCSEEREDDLRPVG